MLGERECILLEKFMFLGKRTVVNEKDSSIGVYPLFPSLR